MSTKSASTARPSNESTVSHSSEESASARKPIDDKNKSPVGSIVDALLEDDVESFVGKYSTEIERGTSTAMNLAKRRR